eukprot:CAMPEP_0118852542 /NCGR_PEP_ID=MMETSP1163-20130328/1501_1 /TAXON_ID=124430 /ORGANISM="Phaeomonas parva, Strain CCMP2877" /LENGTH=584 /DNA_ID=CAMNT_0006784979 /DNA_START=113 /DNA_END=1867 /DNA_ORIENTATION=+
MSLKRKSSSKASVLSRTDSLTMTLWENVRAMNDATNFDVVIVCTGTQTQANYWQQRLEDGRGVILGWETQPLAVCEDWDGGAGNALGTLYAFKKACDLAKTLGYGDLKAKLDEGSISIGMYHTAGKGTRLAPLPGSENNNKPGVKLPASIEIGGRPRAITILEAVVKQTSVYAEFRKGRLSVFWGDQVFIPSVPIPYEPNYHIDILCKLGPMPTAEEWEEGGLDKYGLIAVNPLGQAAQVDKVDFDTATELLQDLGEIDMVGTSLGSFSVSSLMLDVLLEEFKDNLAKKSGKFDTDPHLWMPMTLPEAGYEHIMSRKISPHRARAHYSRIQAMMDNLKARDPECMDRLFGAVNVGKDSIWWDYGQLKLYYRNMMLLRDDSEEASLARSFLGMPGRTCRSEVFGTSLDGRSVVQGCSLGAGRVSNSVLCNVHAAEIDADGCILVNITAKKITARPGSLVYNVVDDTTEGIIADENVALAGVWREDGSDVKMKAYTSIDTGKLWEQREFDNPHTFKEVYDMNRETDVAAIERRRLTRQHAAQREVLSSVETKTRDDSVQSVILRSIPSFLLGGAVGALAFMYMRRK